MNRDRHRYWSAYIADLQKRMKLADWRIKLARKPTESECTHAAACFTGPRREAYIRLSKGFDKLPRVQQRKVVVHELLHCHLHPLTSHLYEQIGYHKEYLAIRDGHSSHEEFIIEDLVQVIIPHMPLPPKAAKV